MEARENGYSSFIVFDMMWITECFELRIGEVNSSSLIYILVTTD